MPWTSSAPFTTGNRAISSSDQIRLGSKFKSPQNHRSLSKSDFFRESELIRQMGVDEIHRLIQRDLYIYTKRFTIKVCIMETERLAVQILQ